MAAQQQRCQEMLTDFSLLRIFSGFSDIDSRNHALRGTVIFALHVILIVCLEKQFISIFSVTDRDCTNYSCVISTWQPPEDSFVSGLSRMVTWLQQYVLVWNLKYDCSNLLLALILCVLAYCYINAFMYENMNIKKEA